MLACVFVFVFIFFSSAVRGKKKTWKKQQINNCYYDSAEETQPQNITLFHKGFSQLKTPKNSLWKTFVLNIIRQLLSFFAAHIGDAV